MLSRLIILLISLASLQLVLCQQDVNSRAAAGPADMQMEEGPLSSGGGGGGQSRTIYSQKHMSPHRMMHFGKREPIEQPLGLTATEFVDLYPPQAIRVPQQQQLVSEDLPYSLFFDTKPVENEVTSRNKYLMDVVEHLLKVTKEQACLTGKSSKGSQQQQQQQFREQPMRLMKLINSDGGNSYEIAADVERQQQQVQSKGEQIDQQQQQPQQEQQLDGTDSPINVVERSLPKSHSGKPFILGNAHIASLLYGRRITEPPSSIMSLSNNYIKKAEPQKMTFMHFG